MINEYVDCLEYKRLIEENKIKSKSLKVLFKNNGIILTSTNSKDLAESVYTIFSEPKDIEHIKMLAFRFQNYEKSTLIAINYSMGTKDDNVLDYLSTELNRLKSLTIGPCFIDRISQIDEGLLLVIMSFEKKNSGKNKLLEFEKRTLHVYIRKQNDQEALVDIRQQEAMDSQKAITLLEQIQNDSSENSLVLKHINLNLLQIEKRIEFFDKISSLKYKEWTFHTISGIAVKRRNPSSGPYSDDDEDNDEGYVYIQNHEDEEDVTTLSGINTAILNGSGLRSNSFVQNCISEGFSISSMKYRFEIKSEPKEFIIEISSKNDLRIDMIQSYVQSEDDKLESHPFSKEDQGRIIQTFQEFAKQLFDNLSQVI